MKGNEGQRVADTRYARWREVFFVHFVLFHDVKGRREMAQ